MYTCDTEDIDTIWDGRRLQQNLLHQISAFHFGTHSHRHCSSIMKPTLLLLLFVFSLEVDLFGLEVKLVQELDRPQRVLVQDLDDGLGSVVELEA
jgi:hypothetical protein